MVEKFHDELDRLENEILEYGKFARGMLVDALTAMKEDDLDLALSVIDRKKRLASWKREIEDSSLRIVALYQPMARDLRAISCINQMNYSLFRVGRIGKSVAKIVKFLSGKPRFPNIKSICYMSDLVIAMLDDVFKAYETDDISPIKNFNERDDVVDNMRTSIFRECLTYMMEDNRNIPLCIDCVTISRHLERCGDHACLMAEKIYFMVTGEEVEIR